MHNMSETAFKQEVEHTIDFYESKTGHAAIRTREMIKRYGGEIEALSRLMISGDLQQGFRVLRDGDHLDKTFEALVVRFKGLFKPEVVQAAEWRLAHPYELI
jgi:hypothetical protein